ncbi:MAG: hypothetical protein HKN60_05545 [Rhizobiales bacterium]|nr:hypothetical protein [Hyphomicrobiales bacterium]
MRVTMKSESERRSAVRRKVGISADLIDPEEDGHYYCHIFDATREGCRIFCDHLHALPDDIRLHPEGMSEPIKAKILWRKPMTAGLEFDWAETLFE